MGWRNDAVRLQKATRCALFAVLELAQDPARQVSAADIAEKYGISAHHLAKVLRSLTRGGLVESMRGAGGGYQFSGNAKRITLYEVISMFEDIAHRTRERSEDGDDSEIGQALGLIMNEIDETAVSTLKSITLTTLLGLVRRNVADKARTGAT
jgi:Rrf2 family protein